jgi:hypothetical protein
VGLNERLVNKKKIMDEGASQEEDECAEDEHWVHKPSEALRGVGDGQIDAEADDGQ